MRPTRRALGSRIDPKHRSPVLLYPGHFTSGHHESYVEKERVLDIIAGPGVGILPGEVVETHGLQLIGLDSMNADENTRHHGHRVKSVRPS